LISGDFIFVALNRRIRSRQSTKQ